MTNVEKLEAWTINARKKGLIDVKFFPEGKTFKEVNLETLAGEILTLLKGTSSRVNFSNITL